MEKVALNNVQLDHLAKHHPSLGPFFHGTVACDQLPRRPIKTQARGYIVNTDLHDLPGRHWIALWTCDNVCEVLDSYALPLEVYETARPLEDWLNTHWKYVVFNGQSLQSVYNQSCGDYALVYLIDRAEGRSTRQFEARFKKHDYLYNDHKVGQMLKKLIAKETMWDTVCKLECHQDCNASLGGVRHLLGNKDE